MPLNIKFITYSLPVSQHMALFMTCELVQIHMWLSAPMAGPIFFFSWFVTLLIELFPAQQQQLCICASGFAIQNICYPQDKRMGGGGRLGRSALDRAQESA